MSANPSPTPPESQVAGLPDRTAARRVTARTAGLFVADGDGFVTRPVTEMELDLEGILLPGLAGDRHRGHSRAADARVPWYPRGTRIRNARQVSILSPDELAEIARALDLPQVTAEEIGANLLVEGIPHLSHLPRGTRLHFPSGASLAIEDENAPCRFAGASVARRNPGRDGLDLAFVKAARHRRGLVAWVERPGRILAGDAIDVRIPEQWIY
jgi:hypothetical protein